MRIQRPGSGDVRFSYRTGGGLAVTGRRMRPTHGAGLGVLTGVAIRVLAA